MKNIIVAVLFSWCCNALAGDLPDLGEPSLGRYELSKGQIAAETGFVALMYVDYRQTNERRKEFCKTRTVLTNFPFPGSSGGAVETTTVHECSKFETNPLLGPTPSEVQLRNYFLGMTLAHVAIAKALPTEYRPYWQGAGIILQLVTVIKNKRLGMSANF